MTLTYWNASLVFLFYMILIIPRWITFPPEVCFIFSLSNCGLQLLPLFFPFSSITNVLLQKQLTKNKYGPDLLLAETYFIYTLIGKMQP